MPFAFDPLYRAFRNQIKAATGFPDARVVWGQVSSDRPNDDFVELEILGVQPLQQMPEEHVKPNPTPTAGNEMLVETSEHFEITLRVQYCSVTQTAEFPKAITGIENIRNYLGRSQTLDLLRAVGSTIINRGPVRHIPTVLNTLYESRAVMEVVLRGRGGHSETVGYFTQLEDLTFDIT